MNNLKQSDTWNIQLTITINFISSKDDNDEECVMHSKNDNVEIIISDEADEVIKNLFDSLKCRYQNIWKVVNLYQIIFSYCLKNFIK